MKGSPSRQPLASSVFWISSSERTSTCSPAAPHQEAERGPRRCRQDLFGKRAVRAKKDIAAALELFVVPVERDHAARGDGLEEAADNPPDAIDEPRGQGDGVG